MPRFEVPTPAGPLSIDAETGKSIVLLGANGAGKTRLGAYIEQTNGGKVDVHRIGAHRSLILNTEIQPPSYDSAENRLFYGYDKGTHGHREGHRWGSKPATHLVNDFDHVVAALYADENRVSYLHRQAHLKDASAKPPRSKLDDLKTIWQSLLPHRELVMKEGSIQVKPPNEGGQIYDAGELSDGERVIFYLVGHALLARKNTMLIVDEPELHINRAILPKLWDAIESKREDCAFIYLTHDIEFTISRRAATKYALKSYARDPNHQWHIELLPEDPGIPEEVVTKIVGSRLPILFVEGDGGSLDAALYRRVYDTHTVVPVGPCDAVVHSVATFQRHTAFHRLGCAGIIDRDGRLPADVEKLKGMKVHSLAVAEVENVLCLPKPFTEMAKLLQYNNNGAKERLDELVGVVLQEAAGYNIRWAVEATRRAIDRAAKSIGLEAKTVDQLKTEFEGKVKMIDPITIHAEYLKEFDKAIVEKNYVTLLRLYDNKGILAHAARVLGQKSRKDLEEFVGRALQSKAGKPFLEALRSELPKF